MNKPTATIICLGILALAFLGFFAVFRKKGKGKIKGPFGMGVEVEGSNEHASRPGVQLKDAQAGGGIRATDNTGQGVVAEKLKAGLDIEISNSGGDAPPKK
jgi:hypothetical protein